MKSKLLLLLIVLFGARADAGDLLSFASDRSTIGFKVRHFLGSATGTFTKFSGKIDLDRDDPENSSVTAAIQVASIDTAIKRRDEHLRGADFFNVTKYPEILFKSTKVTRSGANTGDITGNLTMHGVTRRITLHATLLDAAPGVGSSSHWRVTTDPLKRSEYGLSWSPAVERVSMVGDEIAVTMDIIALAEQPK